MIVVCPLVVVLPAVAVRRHRMVLRPGTLPPPARLSRRPRPIVPGPPMEHSEFFYPRQAGWRGATISLLCCLALALFCALWATAR